MVVFVVMMPVILKISSFVVPDHEIVSISDMRHVVRLVMIV